MVTFICLVTSPSRLRDLTTFRRVAARLSYWKHGGLAIWMASRKVSHLQQRVLRLWGSTRANRAEISSS